MSWLFGHVEKRVDWKDKVNFKIYDVTAWEKQTTANHILPNVSQSKSNQTVELSQLIQYNMRKIFLENHTQNCRGETISRSFSKKLKLSKSLDQ